MQDEHDPLYALLVFGPEAKVRIWAVLDGKALWLLRDGKRLRYATVEDCRDIELSDPDPM